MLANEAASVSGRYICPQSHCMSICLSCIPPFWTHRLPSVGLSERSMSPRPWKMVMVDQRNHGASSEVRGFHPPHSIQASAGDLLSLVQKKLSGRVPDVLVGHSLGGKTVLELLRQLQDSGQQLPKQVFVLDSPLGETNGSSGVHSDTEKVIGYPQRLSVPSQAVFKHIRPIRCPDRRLGASETGHECTYISGGSRRVPHTDGCGISLGFSNLIP